MRLGNGNESDSSSPTIRLATLIRGARTAAGGERQKHFPNAHVIMTCDAEALHASVEYTARALQRRYLGVRDCASLRS